jgi:Na+/melibiose symporter-like transporter
MSNQSSISWLSYAAYGLLGLPLAMSALPVYVQIPAYYTTQLGMTLVSAGWILFLARFIDALQDPLLGYLIDRMPGKLTLWFFAAGLMLSCAFYGLWLPPITGNYLPYWLALMLVLAYSAHSMLNIAYLTWGARINHHLSASLLGAAAWREGAGLIGVIAASVIPSLIFSSAPYASNLSWYCAVFALLLMLAIVALQTKAPAWQRVKSDVETGLRQQLQLAATNPAFKNLLIPYFINAVSVSIPATLVVFFINDRLQAPDYVPAFLATYFVAAALGLPYWVQVANKWGVALSWRLGMLLAIVAFVSAGMLTAGQIAPFFIVCAASGFALGADLALPPVLLAQVIQADAPPAAYYGIWTLLGKFALAISGLALPLLASLDYQPGHPANAPLAWVYAGLPCGLKCVAFILLMRNSGTFQVRTA